MVRTGDTAPDFELTGADRKNYRLQEQLGAPVVLAFYRGDDTAVCSRQLDQYNKAFLEWRKLGVRVFGISPDPPESHFSFGCRVDLAFPLLSDQDRTVAKAYRVPTSVVRYGRSTFVLDASGVVRAELRPRLAGLFTYPSVDEVDQALKNVVGTATED